MSRSLGNTIADSLELSLVYGERLLAGLEKETFGRFAAPGGQQVISNHPAFIYGHLSLYASRILTDVGLDPIPVPEGFETLFNKDATCQDDPDGTIYPEMDVVTSTYFTGYHAARDALRQASDEALQEANPLGGRMTELFPTKGSMHNFYVGGHMMIHMGQLSAWRRMMGLAPA